MVLKARIAQKQDVSERLDAIERQLRLIRAELEHLSEFEARTEAVVERKVYEIKAVSYVTLIVSSVLLSLVFGMLLNALGVRIG